MKVHLDTDFLIVALTVAGPERRKLTQAADSESRIEMSAIAWYEFVRGPRTPEQLAVARAFLTQDGVIAFTEDLALHAAEVFRSLGSPRKRAADIAIGVTASVHDGVLFTRNKKDFAGIPNLRLETAT
jgi:predicted nucleic acid-binding protein